MRKLVFATLIPSWSVAVICAAVLMLAGCGPSGSLPMDAHHLYGGSYADDGDTFTHKGNRYRLARIDAPELPDHKCPAYGRKSCVDSDPVWAGESKRYLQDILDSHAIACDAQAAKVDVYGRFLTECWFEEEDGSWSSLNNLMLTSGMAQPYRYK